MGLVQKGICLDCKLAKIIISAKASRFIQCQKHFEDNRFAKYPRLPVMACLGFEKQSCRESPLRSG
jgi:hypothetical protein